MNMQPIQVLENGVLIPDEYLPEADDYEVVRIGNYAVLRAKSNASQSKEELESWLRNKLDTRN